MLAVKRLFFCVFICCVIKPLCTLGLVRKPCNVVDSLLLSKTSHVGRSTAYNAC